MTLGHLPFLRTKLVRRICQGNGSTSWTSLKNVAKSSGEIAPSSIGDVRFCAWFTGVVARAH